MHETSHHERAFLVYIHEPGERWPQEILAQEFRHLAESSGLEVDELLCMKLREINPATYIGSGKVEDVAARLREKIEGNGARIDVIIFSSALNFRQQHNLEDIFFLKTIDRTQLILDIFARHASTREGKLQVELAQLQYLLPRLKGKGIMLTRQGGGIGTIGPGEKKLEIDRRRIEERIDRITAEIARVRGQRAVMRKKRQKTDTKICSLVGYTSAGKSTLFNALAGSREATAAELFTTLDTVSNAVMVRPRAPIVITDTVGFLYKLPLHVVDAFRATLEELHFADVLVHVVDASIPDSDRLKGAVDTVLAQLHVAEKPVILVFNKIDITAAQQQTELARRYPQALFISALKGTHVDALKEAVYQAVFGGLCAAEVRIPFTRMDVVGTVHKRCEVISTHYYAQYAAFLVKAPAHELAYLRTCGVEIIESDTAQSAPK